MRRLDNERGGVAVFVALLLVVMFGMGALVLDVGHMFWERRQLQNGADAGALALAADCVEGTVIDCAADGVPILGGVAEQYADDNADDGASAVVDTDGDGVPDLMAHGSDPSVCDPGGSDAENPLYVAGTDAVKVSTHTLEQATGDFFLTHWLAPVLGIDTAVVRACAVAGWGGVGGPINVLPLTICEDPHYNTLTSNGTVFGPPKDHIFFGKDECAFSTDTYAGGFGWLDLDSDANIDPANGTCSISATEDQWHPGRTGTDTNTATYSDCILALHNYLDDNGGEALVYVPIFSDYCGPNVAPCGAGEHKFYIEGFAGFMLSGYGFVGGGSHYTYPNASTCAGGSPPVCIYGYFTEFITYDGFINNTAGGFGGTTIQLLN